MPRLLPLLVCVLVSCQIEGTLFEKTYEPKCAAADTTRACFCDDERLGVAQCFGPGDSGPCDCEGQPPGGGVVELAMGGLHTCAVLDDGRVTCWGDNADGQLADGSRTGSTQPTATRVRPDVEQLALGGDDVSGHGCALSQDLTLQCWGRNDSGQLGNAAQDAALEPVEVALPEPSRIAAGASHTCAITRDAEALCWGDDAHMQLGYRAASGQRSAAPTAVGGGLELVEIALGRYHSCAIDSAGEVWCWGEDAHGQLGDGGDAARAEPVRVEGLAGVTQLTLGAEHSCAVDADHEVLCWGRNHRGQLGDGTLEDRRTPVRVGDLPESAALASGWNHTCALARGGSVRCWGDNAHGQLGDGETSGSASPVEVHELDDARAIAAAVHSSCATRSDGSVRCWGDNRAGQLGDGSEKDRRTPVGVRWLESPLSARDGGSM